MSDSLASLPWSNNSDRKPMISRRDFTKVASVAALAVLPLIVWEGREAMRGKACGCC